jgi:hypothetical protein
MISHDKIHASTFSDHTERLFGRLRLDDTVAKINKHVFVAFASAHRAESEAVGRRSERRF